MIRVVRRRSERLLTPAWAGAVGVFLLIVGLGLFSYRGTLETSDEILMAMTSASLAERLSPRFEEEVFGQRWTGYGLGMPLAGVPVYVVERAIRSRGGIASEDFTLFPLTNLFLLGLAAMLLGSLLEGQKRWAAAALVVVASPLFPAAQTYYSEGLATVGLLGVAAAAWHGAGAEARGRLWWLAAGALLAALAGTLARAAMAPFLLFVLIWGWRLGARWQVLAAGAAGVMLGGLATMAQNAALFGGPLRTGYEGQAFTTPLPTGLMGLLVSPERGMLVFFPALLLPLALWRQMRGRMRSFLALASGLTIVSLVFHGTFWTWHGGWTAGPRFLLPVMALWVVPVADLLLRQRELGPGQRTVLWLALGWSGLLSFIYLQHSPVAWWNQLWGAHRLENQWLFLPQLSLWQAWLEGVPLPDARAALSGQWQMSLTGAALVLVSVSLYPLLVPFRGYLGTDAPEQRPLRDWPRPGWPLLAGAAALALLAAVGGLRGPRGWEVRDFTGMERERASHALFSGQARRLEGWLDYPLAAPMELVLRAEAIYRVRLNGEVVLEQQESVPAHYARAEVNPGPGYHLLEIEFAGRDADRPPAFRLYWTWGGEGRYLAPAGGEYLHPRPLEPRERFFTGIWRRKELLGAAGVALLLLFMGLHGGRERLPGA